MLGKQMKEKQWDVKYWGGSCRVGDRGWEGEGGC